MKYPHALQVLIDYLKKFPGVGQKSAERFAFHLIDWETEELKQFAAHLATLKQTIRNCKECGCLLNNNQCDFCHASDRNKSVLCILASAKEVFAIEETGTFQGLYHVLGSLISPIDHKGFDLIDLDKICDRIRNNHVQEVIFALDSTVEGDATTLYLKKTLKQFDLTISRLAAGLPVGSSLEYVDGSTLSRALIDRYIF